MQDFDPTNPFATEVQPEATQPEPVQVQDELSSFIGEVAEEFQVPDMASVVTIKTSGGLTRYVPVPEGTLMTASELLLAANLTVNGQFQTWLNEAQIDNNAVVPAGSTITIVGTVKGG